MRLLVGICDYVSRVHEISQDWLLTLKLRGDPDRENLQ